MTHSLSDDSLLSGNGEKAMATLLGVMLGLKDLYRKETEAMRLRDINKFLSLQPAKEAYTKDYELLTKEIQARSATIKKGDSPLRARLIEEQKELAMLAEESLTWSLRMADSLKRVQDRLITAAREALKAEKASYAPTGSFDSSGRPVATAFNESC